MNQRLEPVPVVALSTLRAHDPNPHEIERARLLALLDAESAAVTLLAAPPGAGKSVLLAQWARHHPGRCAWVSLGQSHQGSLVAVWAAVLEALGRLDRGLAALRLGSLVDPGHVLDHTIPRLLNRLSDVEPLALVLDGLEHVAHDRACASLVHFLSHMPANVRVLISTSRPSCGALHRLRWRGRLSELPADLLRFTDVEAQQLLERISGGPVAEAAARRLNERLDGWAVGLSIAGRDEAAVLDYVRLEVLDRTAPRERAALLRTSVLSRPECATVAAVAGQETVRILDSLADSTLFIRRAAGGWVCHPAVRSAALAELGRTDPGLRSTLQSRAARHVAEAWPVSDPVSLLEVAGRPNSREALAVASAAAAAALVARSDDLARQFLAYAPETPCSVAVRALGHLQAGELLVARRLAEGAECAERGAALQWHESLLDLVLGATALWANRPLEAIGYLESAVAAATASGYDDALVRALDHLVACADLTGDSSRASSLAREASAIHDRAPMRSTPPVIAFAYLGSSEVPPRGRSGRTGSPHSLAYAAYLRASAARRAGDHVAYRFEQAEARSALAPEEAGPVLGMLLADDETGSCPARLTDRELVVLRALCGPLSLREIARELHVSHNTVKSQVGSLFRKLSVHDRADAQRAARELRVFHR